MLLIQGGALDPHIGCLVRAAHARGLALAAPLTGPGTTPRVHWDLDGDVLFVDGAPLTPTAAFLRYNVFSQSSREADAPGSADSFRAQAWFAFWQGWISSHPNVRAFNRRFGGGANNKPEQLWRADRAGLAIPRTLITNDIGVDLRVRAGDVVAKPVAGGGYTHTLAEAIAPFELGAPLPAPALVQNRLVPPETRVFVVGTQCLAFRVEADALDYREAPTQTVTAVDVPAGLTAPLLRLADDMGLDFAAADFKTDAVSGQPVFLEINSGPMFARFDMAAEGALCVAMLAWLCPA